MLKELLKKANTIKQHGFMQHYRRAFADAHGVMSIGVITAECISILVLICILVILPLVASNIQDNLPAINSTSAWSQYTNAGVDTWANVSPLITVSVLVVIIGLVLHVIYSLKTRQ